MLSSQRVAKIVQKEMRQVLRDPKLRIVLFVPPILQLIVFGFAVNLDVETTRLMWLDEDRSFLSRELREGFEASPKFEILRDLRDTGEIDGVFDRGEAMAVVVVPADFEKDIQHGDLASVQVLVDGTNSNTASIVTQYSTELIAAFNTKYTQQEFQRLAVGRGNAAAMKFPGVDAETRVWFNEDLLSRVYFVPGVLVNILALVTVMLTAMSVVREKEIGTLEQLLVTPIRPIELMLGKTLPFAMLGLVQMAIMTVVALVIFEVPLRGSFLFLMASATVFLLSTLGAGLFISTISQTQQQAMMTFFLLFLPMFLLSGFTFPIRSMPVFFQYLTYLDPLRYFMEVVRGVFLKGVGFSVLWPQVMSMTVFGVATLIISAMRFRKTLD